MDKILHDLSPENLIIAIEENLASWISVFSKLEGSRINDIPGVKRSISDIRMALFNSIMDARLTVENVDATVQHVVVDSKKRNVPLLWWVGPSTRPPELATYLERYGFSIDEDSPGMAVGLDELNESLPMLAGLNITPALSEASQLEWCMAMAAGFEIPLSMTDFVVDSWRKLLSLCDPKITIAFLARLNGKPVATSLLQLGGGVAGIYAVATIPEARRKGIGAQVTLFPLLEARVRGYKAGVLEASDMGVSVYRSLGFREYCQISSYRWSPVNA